ncbi:uncharacterized protein RB166_003189 [Leptodactylus fuscus]
MATEKRGHTSRPAQYLLAKDGYKSQSSRLIVLPCKHATIMPCLATAEQRLPNHQRKPPGHNNDIYRCNSRVLDVARRTYTQYSSQTEVCGVAPSSTNSRILSAPRSLVTYFHLCRPIIPRVRTNSSGLRSRQPYIYKSRTGDTFKQIKLNSRPGLAVYGVPLGQVQPSQNAVEKIQIHVYLPSDQHQSEEEVSSKLNLLNLQECKNPEDDNMATI